MAEFGASATLSVQVPDSELRAARAKIEDELGELSVSVDASTSGGRAARADGGIAMPDGGSNVPGLLEESVELLDDIEEHLADPARGAGGGGGGGGGGMGAAGLLARLAPALAIGGGGAIGHSIGQALSSDDLQSWLVEQTGIGVQPENRPDRPGVLEPGGLVDRGFGPEEDSPAARTWQEVQQSWSETMTRLEGFEWPALPTPQQAQDDTVQDVVDSQRGNQGTSDRGGREPINPDARDQLTESDPGSGARVIRRSNAPNIVVEDNTTVNVDAVEQLERTLNRKKDEIARDVERRLDQRFDRGLQR